MRSTAVVILALSMVAAAMAQDTVPDSSTIITPPGEADSPNGLAWRAAMSAALGNDANLSNISPDLTLGWVITVNDSLVHWPRIRSLGSLGYYLPSLASQPVRYVSRLIMGNHYHDNPRTAWRLQAGPTLSAQRRAETITDYFQALMQPAPAGFSLSSFWTRANYTGDPDSITYMPVRIVGAIGWGIKFYGPYEGLFRDYSSEAADPRRSDSLFSPWASTDSMALDGIVQHYFRAGLGMQLGRYLGLSANYSLAYHDVVRTSHDSFVKLFGHKPEADGFQYLTLNLQTLVREGDGGNTYFDITWWQQLERRRFGWLKDREVLTISLRQDFRELPMAFTN
ncbi:MAG: hypothetical protein ACOZB3_04300 [Calditrichota bacterium]